MNRYRFEFEELLRVKQQTEDHIKNGLSRERKILEVIESDLENAKKEKQSESSKILDQLAKLQIADLKNFYLYQNKMDDVISISSKKAILQRTKVERIRDRLMAVAKERRMLEKMKEKQLESHKEQMISEEQNESDEIANFKFFLKQGNYEEEVRE